MLLWQCPYFSWGNLLQCNRRRPQTFRSAVVYLLHFTKRPQALFSVFICGIVANVFQGNSRQSRVKCCQHREYHALRSRSYFPDALRALTSKESLHRFRAQLGLEQRENAVKNDSLSTRELHVTTEHVWDVRSRMRRIIHDSGGPRYVGGVEEKDFGRVLYRYEQKRPEIDPSCPCAVWLQAHFYTYYRV